MVLIWILASTIIISLISLIGILTLFFKEEFLNNILLILVGFSAGALLGGAFFHLLPESLESVRDIEAFIYLIIGFLTFFSLERFLHWRHCHDGKCDVHVFTYLNLIGDTVHNFIDGLIIAASFLISFKLGIITTLAVILHEIPQEFGDFGVLVYGGFSKMKALLFNFYTALSCVLGGLIGYFIINAFYSVSLFLLPFTAGGFIYIASADLIPEIHKEEDLKKSAFSTAFFILGITFMLAVKIILE
ncbi:MAG: ZIP family metal transporter [Actinomycetia bacterium]|nr:ZIP family metal transporter [Actinomycetes bacterium]